MSVGVGGLINKVLMKGDISDQLKKAFIRRNEEVRFDGEKKKKDTVQFVGGYLTHISFGNYMPQKKLTTKIKGFFSKIL